MQGIDTSLEDVLSRRSFMKLSVLSGFALGAFSLAASAQDSAPKNTLKPYEQPSAFVQIKKDGTVTVTVNRLEFGQSILTGLSMILAEELDADWSNVRAVLGNADPAYIDPVDGIHVTGGSGSTKHSYQQYRELGARARAMLLAAASAHWGVNVDHLHTESGKVVGPTGESLRYGDLADAAMQLPVPQLVTLKLPKDFRIIGKSIVRIDARAKSTGTQKYGIDIRLPGMLTAIIAHPPVFGCKIKTFNDSAAKAVKGVKAILRVTTDRDGEGIAVIADGYWSAKKGRDALVIEWDTAAAHKVDSVAQLAHFKELAKRTGAIAKNADMTPMAKAPRKIVAEYSFPYLAHAAMEPLNCTVHVQGKGDDMKVALLVGSQLPGLDTAAAAKVFGIPEKNVEIEVQMTGGGFGRRVNQASDFVKEACHVAKLAHEKGLNAPIQVIWSREDDMRAGYYRPSNVHRAEIGFDSKGKVLAWDHVVVGQSILESVGLIPVSAGEQRKKFVDGTAIEGLGEPYDVPMRLSVHHPRENMPVLWWRSVGSSHTAYVMETLIDEIARETKQDPVAYRLQMWGDKYPRQTAALQLAVEKSGYGKRALPPGRAWGVAVHQAFGTVVAYVVEASVSKRMAKLHAVTAGIHCNLAVNPKAIEAQAQGAIIMALGTCLPGAEITLKNGLVEQSNFSDYTVARMPDMPRTEVHVVPSADAPTGMGEPGFPPLAPAFANAIAKLTGKIPRKLPFKLS
nr:xanthine dehydrogenase family protein molybdopterin-binding subunit [uncultured Undibacterium sp.]